MEESGMGSTSFHISLSGHEAGTFPLCSNTGRFLFSVCLVLELILCPRQTSKPSTKKYQQFS